MNQQKAQDAADAAAETDIGQVLNKFSDYVPTARKINGYSLSSNITLTPSDLKNEPWKSTKQHRITVGQSVTRKADTVRRLSRYIRRSRVATHR